MAPPPLPLLLLLLLVFPFFFARSSLSYLPAFMRLQHRYSGLHGSSKHGLPMTLQHSRRLVLHDTLRHRHLLQAVSFPVGGHANPYSAGNVFTQVHRSEVKSLVFEITSSTTVLGAVETFRETMGVDVATQRERLYFTELQIGTPPSAYYAQVDTGSDLLWLACDSCRTCPSKTNLGVHLQSYSPGLSRTSHVLPCDEEFCGANCEPGKLCAYKLTYGDGSTAEGYYVQDLLQLDSANRQSSNSTVVFGCTIFTNRGLDNHAQNRDQALDGILGLGQSNSSLIQQLALQKVTPRVFGHCLEGEDGGGGLLVVGQVMEPGLSYTPIQSNQLHYNVNLKSIDVNGHSLKVAVPSNETGKLSGTIFDSGTTLAYVPQSIYEDFLQQILLSQNSEIIQGDDEFACIVYEGSLDEGFPPVIFTFDGGSTMRIEPHDYFIQVKKERELFCFGFLSSPADSPGVTILGDIILKNRLVVYDLENQRIGWRDYNCSSNVTVSTSHGMEEFSATTVGGSGRLVLDSAVNVIAMAIQMLIFVFLS